MQSNDSKVVVRPRAQAGFSLVELIFAILFTGLVITALMNVFSSSVENNAENELLTQAVSLLNEKMEEVRADKSGKGFNYLDSENYDAETITGGFVRTVEFVEYSEYKEVTIRITHPSMPDMTLSSIMTNY